jgi:hypothetical protein
VLAIRWWWVLEISGVEGGEGLLEEGKKSGLEVTFLFDAAPGKLSCF